MTSTPSSTRSNFAWRSVSKKRAPTSVSLIVAKPEAGAPLASAVTQLPVSRMASDADFKSSKEREREGLSSPEEPADMLPAESRAAPTVTSEEVAAMNRPGAATNDPGTVMKEQGIVENNQDITMNDQGPDQPSPSVSVAPALGELNISAHSSSIAPSTSSSLTVTPVPRSSWFASLSHGNSSPQKPVKPAPLPSAAEASNKSARDVVPYPLPLATEVSTAAPVMNIVPPTPPRPPPAPSNASSTVPVSIPVKRAWFSPTSSPTPTVSRPPPAQSPPPLPAVAASPLTPSSIDSEVPSLSPSDPPPQSVSPQGILSPDPNQNLASLNPSLSRFSLSIPFLGRPKVPLEKALASATAADIREPEAPSPVTAEEPAPPASVKEPETAVPPAPAPEKPTSVTSSQSSWWGYVGWSATVITQEPPQSETVPNADAGPSQASVPTTLPDVAASPEPEPAAGPQPEAGASSTEGTQAAASSYSGWYSPWAWYGSSAEVTRSGEEKTDAELVKEEALAREPSMSVPVDPAPPPPPPPPPPPAALVNPIEGSIAANLPAWTSFFSSRTLLAKRITASEHNAAHDENGMEVMDIDEEETSKDKDKDAKPAATVAQPSPAPPKSPAPSVKPEEKKKRPENLRATKRKSISPSPSPSRSGRASPTMPRSAQPNLVLPTWDDTFRSPPRSTMPPAPTSTLKKTLNFVSGVLFAKDEDDYKGKGKARARAKERDDAQFGKALPRAWDVVGDQLDPDVLRGSKRVVVIGIHGWFPGAVMRTVLGEPTGTSSKFVTMMCQALEVFQEQHGVQFEKITQIPLEGEGTIKNRVNKLYDNLTGKQEWMDDLHASDAILVATHSQGCIVSTHLLDRLIRDKHIRTARTADIFLNAAAAVAGAAGGSSIATPGPQRVCCLALCGIHLGPLRYLSSSSLLQPYIQYFESAAAKELFEFQNTESEVSKTYVKALRNVVDHGTKMVYIASLNDQVVPIYSGLFTAVSHPLILRALYIDGDAYHSSDFLSNLLVLLLRVVNTGLSDSGLLAHLSEATAGSLNGVGHSTAYEELATYSLAVKYLFLTNHGLEAHPELVVEPFNANTEQNDYEIPWSLRDLIANERVAHFFWKDFADLRNAFPNWHPKTTILRDIKRKLQPIQRLNSIAQSPSGSSKL